MGKTLSKLSTATEEANLKFRNTKDLEFYKRNQLLLQRSFQGEISWKWDLLHTHWEENYIRAHIQNSNLKDKILDLTITFWNPGLTRIQIKQKLDETKFDISQFAFGDNLAQLKPSKIKITDSEESLTIVQEVEFPNSPYIKSHNLQIEHKITKYPFKITSYIFELPVFEFNSNNLLNFEDFRTKGEQISRIFNNKLPSDTIDLLFKNLGKIEDSWDEYFEKLTYNSIAGGLRSIGADIKFPLEGHLFGLSERGSFDVELLNTKERIRDREPYRLFNSDRFAGRTRTLNSSLYGTAPLIISKNLKYCIGALWMNGSDSVVDIYENKGRCINWVSEAGCVDLWTSINGNPLDMYTAFMNLWGKPAFPPLFSLGYHQCKWNYWTQLEALEIDHRFDEHEIPYDTLWLDIEYTDKKKYFTWDKNTFPEPENMFKILNEKGRKMVIIIDPHVSITEGYHVYEQLKKNNCFVQNADKSDFIDTCWAPKCSWIDVLNRNARELWASFHMKENFLGEVNNMHIWNDMNEPSVFGPAEGTMPKDLLHKREDGDSVEHREVHNIYGLGYSMATYDGLIKRYEGKQRPFALTRSFFPGSQKYAAIWTGDSGCEWSEYRMNISMLLTLGLSGFSFVGGDIPGFYLDPPSEELVIRWYQMGCLNPFFRGHAHRKSASREPWCFSESTKESIKKSIKLRYNLILHIYKMMWEHHNSGIPVIAPIWVQYPEILDGHSLATQFCLGKEFIVAPVLYPGVNRITVYLPNSFVWYDYCTHKAIIPFTESMEGIKLLKLNHEVNIDTFGLFLRGGSIIPIQKDECKSSQDLLEKGRISLIIAPDSKTKAKGLIYIDDGESFEYEKGNYLLVEVSFNGQIGALQIEIKNKGNYVCTNKYKHIFIWSKWGKAISQIKMNDNTQEIPFTYKDENLMIDVEKFDIPVSQSISIMLI